MIDSAPVAVAAAAAAAVVAAGVHVFYQFLQSLRINHRLFRPLGRFSVVWVLLCLMVRRRFRLKYRRPIFVD